MAASSREGRVVSVSPDQARRCGAQKATSGAMGYAVRAGGVRRGRRAGVHRSDRLGGSVDSDCSTVVRRQWWWVAIARRPGSGSPAARMDRLPEGLSGDLADLQTGDVKRDRYRGFAAYRRVTHRLRQLGQEKGSATWRRAGVGSPREGRAPKSSQVNTLAGFAGCLRRAVLQNGDRGAVILEVGAARRQRFLKTLAAEIVAIRSHSVSTSPSPAPCSWTNTRCRPSSTRTGS